MASRAEFGIFAVIAAAGSFGRGDRLLESPKILLAICLLLCGVSGYIAAQFRRLPRRKRDAPGAFFSEFSGKLIPIFKPLIIFCKLYHTFVKITN